LIAFIPDTSLSQPKREGSSFKALFSPILFSGRLSKVFL